MDVGIGCRHRDVEWHDEYHCTCNECGKVGEWFDEGFTLWRRTRGAGDLASRSDRVLLPVASVGTARQAS